MSVKNNLLIPVPSTLSPDILGTLKTFPCDILEAKISPDVNKIIDEVLSNDSFTTVATPEFLQNMSVSHPSSNEYSLLAINRWLSFTFPVRLQPSDRAITAYAKFLAYVLSSAKSPEGMFVCVCFQRDTV